MAGYRLLSYKKIIPILITAPIVISGIFHWIISYWTYQNLPWNLPDEKSRLSQTDLNYEITNFQKVGEVVSQVNDGDWDVLSSGIYKIEVTDAAIQALSEKALKSTVERLQLLSGLPQGKRKAHRLLYLKEMIDELDSSSMHQIYPLLADDEKYLAFFYDGDHDLKDFVIGLTNNLNGQLAAKNLEEAYFENMPCATFWPVICVYF